MADSLVSSLNLRSVWRQIGRTQLAIWLRANALHGRRWPLLLVLGWLAFYLRSVRRIQLHRGRRSWAAQKANVSRLGACVLRMDEILRRCPSLSMMYWPTFYAPTALLQFSLLGLKEFRARVLQPTPYTREVLQLRDHAHIALDWVAPRQTQTDGPVCVLLHGAFQGSESVTMIDLATSLAARGHPVVVMSRRGYGGVDLGVGGAETAALHMFGDDEDLDEVLMAVARRYPSRPVAVIGFSCGSGFCGRYVGNRSSLSAWSGHGAESSRRGLPPLLCGVAYDPGYDVSPEGAVSKIAPPYSWVVNWCYKYFYVFRHRHVLRKKSASTNTLVSQLLSPSSGLGDTYRKGRRLSGADDSSAYLNMQQPKLSDVEVPTLLINSRDDPICVWHNVEEHRREIDANPNVALAELWRGAHGCKFNFWGTSSVTFTMIAEFVEACWDELSLKS